MKRIKSLILPIVLVLSFVGCAGGAKLTTGKAQNAIDLWLAGGKEENKGLLKYLDFKVKVLGVQEMSQDNKATANLDFTNFPTKDGFGTQVSYTGSGTASFTHYTDGRWVLTRIDIMHQNGTQSWVEPNVEVK